MIDAVVIGSGPNGLAAALTLARAGLSVHIVEGASTLGGGCRTEELTLPGFRHDVCSSVHPLLVASPFFRDQDRPVPAVPLLFPEVAVAHPLDGGRAAGLTGSVAETASHLGVDGDAYRRLLEPMVEAWPQIIDAALSAPLRSIPSRPLAAARFAALGVLPASRLVRRFRTEEAAALLGGAAAHSIMPLEAPLSGAFGLLLATLAHAVGWPVVAGGTSVLVDVMSQELSDLGATWETGRWVRSTSDLPAARMVLADVTPRQLVGLVGSKMGAVSRWQMGRFGYGAGVCKLDLALSGPVPWDAELCRRSPTIHLGGSFAEMARSESDVAAGRHPERPYCIVVQAGVVDPSRAPTGSHTLWAYCHTPPGSTKDMTPAIEAQIERFAPGFRDLIQARAWSSAADHERRNPNYVGGDITSGAPTLFQTLFRPTVRWNPYRTGLKGWYLCGASTPPGGGVHGMCGYWAARTALADLGLDRPIH